MRESWSPNPVVQLRQLFEGLPEVVRAPVEMVVFGGELPRADVSEMRWLAGELRNKAEAMNGHADDAKKLLEQQDSVGVFGDHLRDTLHKQHESAVGLGDRTRILADRTDGSANEAEKTLCVMFVFGIELCWRIIRLLAVSAAAGPGGTLSAAPAVEAMLAKGRIEVQAMRVGLERAFERSAVEATAKMSALGPLRFATTVGRATALPVAVDAGTQLLQVEAGYRDPTLIGDNGENPRGFDTTSVLAAGVSGAGGAVGGALAGSVAAKAFPRIQNSRLLLGLVHGSAGGAAGLGSAALVTGWPERSSDVLAAILNGAFGGAASTRGGVEPPAGRSPGAVIDGAGAFSPPDAAGAARGTAGPVEQARSGGDPSTPAESGTTTTSASRDGIVNAPADSARDVVSTARQPVATDPATAAKESPGADGEPAPSRQPTGSKAGSTIVGESDRAPDEFAHNRMPPTSVDEQQHTTATMEPQHGTSSQAESTVSDQLAGHRSGAHPGIGNDGTASEPPAVGTGENHAPRPARTAEQSMDLRVADPNGAAHSAGVGPGQVARPTATAMPGNEQPVARSTEKAAGRPAGVTADPSSRTGPNSAGDRGPARVSAPHRTDAPPTLQGRPVEHKPDPAMRNVDSLTSVRPGTSDRPGTTTDRPGATDRPGTSDQPGASERPGTSGRSAIADQLDTSDRPAIPDRAERSTEAHRLETELAELPSADPQVEPDLAPRQNEQFTAAAKEAQSLYRSRREELAAESWEQRRQAMERGDEVESLLRYIDATREGTGKTPRWNQLEAFLLGEHGFMRQMGTGQGKSMVGALDALRQLSRGEPVELTSGRSMRVHHVLTTTETLANDGVRQSESMLRSLGYDVSRWDPNNPPPEPERPTVYYLTYDERATAELHDRPPPGKTATIDEADAVLVHNQTVHHLSDGQRELASDVARTEVYRVRDFLRQTLFDRVLTSADLRTAAEASLAETHRLWERKTGRAFTAEETEMARAFLDVKAGRLKLNRDFQVFDGKIQILDEYGKPRSDPKTATDSRWFGGRHKMVEAMFGVDVYSDGTGSKQVTVEDVFGGYERLQLMSGTLENTAAEIKENFPVEGGLAKIEDFGTSKLEAEQDRIFLTEPDKLKDAVTRVQQLQNQGRPVLVICPFNDVAQKFSLMLAKAGVEHDAIDAQWFADHRDNNLAEEKLLGVKDRAGERGAITIGTGMLGRGFDVTITDEVNELGGVHAQMLGRSSTNPDEDHQWASRAGRNGRNGSYSFDVAVNDPLYRETQHHGAKVAITHYRTAVAEHAEATANAANAAKTPIEHAITADLEQPHPVGAEPRAAQAKVAATEADVAAAEREMRSLTSSVQQNAADRAYQDRVLRRANQANAPPPVSNGTDTPTHPWIRTDSTGVDTLRPHLPADRFARLAAWLGVPESATADAAVAVNDDSDEPLSSLLNRAGISRAAVQALNQHLDHAAPASVGKAVHLDDEQALAQLMPQRDQLANQLGLAPEQVAGAEGLREVGRAATVARDELALVVDTPTAEVSAGTARGVLADAVTHELVSDTEAAPTDNMAGADTVRAASRYLATQTLLDLVLGIHQRSPKSCVNNGVTMMRVLHPDNEQHYDMPAEMPLRGHVKETTQLAFGGSFDEFDSLDAAARPLSTRPGGSQAVVYQWMNGSRVESHLVLLVNDSDRIAAPKIVVLDIAAAGVERGVGVSPKDLANRRSLLDRGVPFAQWRDTQQRLIEKVDEPRRGVHAIEFDHRGTALDPYSLAGQTDVTEPQLIDTSVTPSGRRTISTSPLRGNPWSFVAEPISLSPPGDTESTTDRQLVHAGSRPPEDPGPSAPTDPHQGANRRAASADSTHAPDPMRVESARPDQVQATQEDYAQWAAELSNNELHDVLAENQAETKAHIMAVHRGQPPPVEEAIGIARAQTAVVAEQWHRLTGDDSEPTQADVRTFADAAGGIFDIAGALPRASEVPSPIADDPERALDQLSRFPEQLTSATRSNDVFPTAPDWTQLADSYLAVRQHGDWDQETIKALRSGPAAEAEFTDALAGSDRAFGAAASWYLPNAFEATQYFLTCTRDTEQATEQLRQLDHAVAAAADRVPSSQFGTDTALSLYQFRLDIHEAMAKAGASSAAELRSSTRRALAENPLLPDKIARLVGDLEQLARDGSDTTRPIQPSYTPSAITTEEPFTDSDFRESMSPNFRPRIFGVRDGQFVAPEGTSVAPLEVGSGAMSFVMDRWGRMIGANEHDAILHVMWAMGDEAAGWGVLPPTDANGSPTAKIYPYALGGSIDPMCTTQLSDVLRREGIDVSADTFDNEGQGRLWRGDLPQLSALFDARLIGFNKASIESIFSITESRFWIQPDLAGVARSADEVRVPLTLGPIRCAPGHVELVAYREGQRTIVGYRELDPSAEPEQVAAVFDAFHQRMSRWVADSDGVEWHSDIDQVLHTFARLPSRPTSEYNGSLGFIGARPPNDPEVAEVAAQQYPSPATPWNTVEATPPDGTKTVSPGATKTTQNQPATQPNPWLAASRAMEPNEAQVDPPWSQFPEHAEAGGISPKPRWGIDPGEPREARDHALTDVRAAPPASTDMADKDRDSPLYIGSRPPDDGDTPTEPASALGSRNGREDGSAHLLGPVDPRSGLPTYTPPAMEIRNQAWRVLRQHWGAAAAPADLMYRWRRQDLPKQALRNAQECIAHAAVNARIVPHLAPNELSALESVWPEYLGKAGGFPRDVRDRANRLAFAQAKTALEQMPAEELTKRDETLRENLRNAEDLLIRAEQRAATVVTPGVPNPSVMLEWFDTEDPRIGAIFSFGSVDPVAEAWHVDGSDGRLRRLDTRMQLAANHYEMAARENPDRPVRIVVWSGTDGHRLAGDMAALYAIGVTGAQTGPETQPECQLTVYGNGGRPVRKVLAYEPIARIMDTVVVCGESNIEKTGDTLWKIAPTADTYYGIAARRNSVAASRQLPGRQFACRFPSANEANLDAWFKSTRDTVQRFEKESFDIRKSIDDEFLFYVDDRIKAPTESLENMGRILAGRPERLTFPAGWNHESVKFSDYTGQDIGWRPDTDAEGILPRDPVSGVPILAATREDRVSARRAIVSRGGPDGSSRDLSHRGLPDDFARASRLATENRRWWNSLPAEEKRAVVALYPEEVGNAPGFPSEVADYANDYRRHATVVELLDHGRENASRSERHAFRNLHAVEEALARSVTVHRDIPRPVVSTTALNPESFAGNGSGTFVIGNCRIEDAEHVVWYVDGVNTRLQSSPVRLAHARNLYEELMRVNPSTKVAVVCWIGYEAPANNKEPWSSRPELAEAGGRLFARDVLALRAVSSAKLSVLGYSYGTPVVAEACVGGRLAGIFENGVTVGSPGRGRRFDSATDISFRCTWVLAQSDDMVTSLGASAPGMRSRTFGNGPFGLGPDPAADPNGIRVQAERGFPQALAPYDGHGEYIEYALESAAQPTEGLRHAVRCLVGRGAEVPTEALRPTLDKPTWWQRVRSPVNDPASSRRAAPLESPLIRQVDPKPSSNLPPVVGQPEHDPVASQTVSGGTDAVAVGSPENVRPRIAVALGATGPWHAEQAANEALAQGVDTLVMQVGRASADLDVLEQACRAMPDGQVSPAVDMNIGPGWSDGEIRAKVTEVAALLDGYAMQWQLRAMDHRVLRQAAELAPHCRRVAVINSLTVATRGLRGSVGWVARSVRPGNNDTADILEEVEQAGATAVAVNARLLSNDFVQCANDAGINVTVWGVDNSRRMRASIGMGIEEIATANPALLRAEIAESGFQVLDPSARPESSPEPGSTPWSRRTDQ